MSALETKLEHIKKYLEEKKILQLKMKSYNMAFKEKYNTEGMNSDK